MKKTLKAIVLMAILTIILSISNISNAFSYNASLNKSTNKLEAGAEVKLTLNLSNIDMDDGILSIKVGNIVVGDAFEAISQSNFTGVNGWAPTYSNGALSISSGTKLTNAGDVVVLTLKVKSGNTAKSSTVKFQNMLASSGTNTGDIKISEVSATIGEENGNDNNSSNPAVSEKQNTPATSSNKNTSANKTKNTSKNTAKNTIQSSKTTAKRILNAGDATTMAIVAVVAIVAIVGCLGFIKYSKNKDIK